MFKKDRRYFNIGNIGDINYSKKESLSASDKTQNDQNPLETHQEPSRNLPGVKQSHAIFVGPHGQI